MSSLSRHIRVALIIGAGVVFCAVTGCVPVSQKPASPTENPWYWALDEEDKDLVNSADLVSEGNGLHAIDVTAGNSYMLLVNRDDYDSVDADSCEPSVQEAVASFEALPQSAFNMPWGPHTYFSFGTFQAHETTSFTIDCGVPEATIISISEPS